MRLVVPCRDVDELVETHVERHPPRCLGLCAASLGGAKREPKRFHGDRGLKPPEVGLAERPQHNSVRDHERRRGAPCAVNQRELAENLANRRCSCALRTNYQINATLFDDVQFVAGVVLVIHVLTPLERLLLEQ